MTNPVGDFLESTRISTAQFLRIPQNQSLIEISLNGKKLNKWKGLTIKSEMDSACAAVSFLTVFDPDDRDFRELFRPDKLPLLDIAYDTDINIIQGFVDKMTPSKAPDGIVVTVEARPIASADVDSNIVDDVYFRRLTLQQASDKVFDRNATFEPDSQALPNIKFEKGETRFEAIAKEAAGQGYWCIPAIVRNFTFKKISSSDKIQAELEDGVDPVLKVTATYDSTKRFHEYVVSGGGNGSSRSFKLVDETFARRPSQGLRVKLVKANRENTDLKAFAERVRSQDIIDSMSLAVDLSSWTFNGKIFQPGGMIQLEAPGAMIYKPYKFCIKTVALTYDEDGEKCSLELTFPNAYDNTPIKDYPWVLPAGSVGGLLPKIRRVLGV